MRVPAFTSRWMLGTACERIGELRNLIRLATVFTALAISA